MKNIVFAVLLTIISTGILKAQEVQNNSRFIEVTGSAEMKVEPDEIRFQIGIEEYWKEEFEKGKEYKDFVTKISLKDIESKLMHSLDKIGITPDQIIIKEIGKNWNRSGKGFVKSKTIELILIDFTKVNEILSNVTVRGVNSMRITELKNKGITGYREQVKIEAMKAAKIKATYLLKSVDEEIGRVISVIELDNSGYFWRPQNMFSNRALPSNSEDSNGENIRKIKLKYEIKIRFEIK